MTPLARRRFSRKWERAGPAGVLELGQGGGSLGRTMLGSGVKLDEAVGRPSVGNIHFKRTMTCYGV
jgi:hypothetical protein